MTNLKAQAMMILTNAIRGPHADHHASVIVGGIWLRSRGDEAAAYAEVLAKVEEYSK
jgi:hypothetical protein